MRKLRKIALWCGLVLGVPLLMWFASAWYYASRFEAEVDALRDSGAIVDLAEFNQPAVPDAENAAILFLEALDWRDEQGLDDCSAAYDLDELADDLDEDELGEAWTRVGQWIDAHAPFFERVERALERPHCDFAVDHTLGWETRVESIPVSQAIAEAYEWRVRLDAHRNESAMDAVGDCETVLRWSRRIDRGFIIAYGVQSTVDSVGCEMLRHVAGMREFDAVRAREILDPLLVAAEDESAFQSALEGDCAVMIDGVRRLATWRGLKDVEWLTIMDTEIPNSFRVSMTALRPLLWKDGKRAVQLWNRARGIIEAGGTTVLSDLEALAAESDWDSDEDPIPPMWRFMTLMYRHLPARAYKYRMQHLAHLRVARVGLTCLAHRQRHGNWPADSGGVIDPFTGKPLVLAPEGDSIRIEAAVSWLDEWEGDFREERRIYWTLPNSDGASTGRCRIPAADEE